MSDSERRTPNRRDFLKLAAAASVAGLSAVRFPVLALADGIGDRLVQVEAYGKLFQGTAEGEILASSNKGKTFEHMVGFGKECPVLELTTMKGVLYATLGYRDFTFRITSPDGLVWYTV